MSATIPPATVRLHRFALSGHAHRVQLMLSLLNLPCTLVDVDLPNGAHKTPAFLARNAFGQVPVLEIDGQTLADSNAILVYLALTRDPQRRWLPVDAATQAQVQRWLSVAAGQLAAGPAAARVARVFGRPHNPQALLIAEQLFGLMDQHLAGRSWLAADHATLADVAMYSYSAHAPEGGIALTPWPALRAWLARTEALPGFVAMPRSALPGAA
jgi:glutathione S-transferase